MLEKIKLAIDEIDKLSKTKPIKIVSHFDTDGITSAAILSRAFHRWDKKFSLEIVKNLEESFIENLSENNILIFSDLASGSLPALAKKNTEVFILDHHEIPEDQEIPSNVRMINPQTEENSEIISGAGVCYLFAKALSLENKDLATLAVVGIVGDLLEKNAGKYFREILEDSETTIKKGLLLYPSTRPINKALEYCSNPYLPGITGSFKGAFELLRDAGITKNGNKFKALYELTEEEMSNLVTALMVRSADKSKIEEMIGNLYLVKFFNKLEDARELSALINACSRMGYSSTALGFCLGNKKCKKQAENIYIEYKQKLVSALKYVSENNHIKGKNYTIINAKDNIKDTIIGTIASIISFSPSYSEGTMIVALAYNKDKIKVSARLAGREGRNVRETLSKVVVPLGGEVGGHPKAAGCLIKKDHEEKFIEELQKVLEIDTIKV